MASPADEETGPAHSPGRKRRASQSSQRCPSPLTKARALGPSSPVYVLRFTRGATGPNKAVLQIWPERLGAEIAKERPEQDRPVYVVRGLPSKFLDEMGRCMGIDRSFVDAHAARGCYRPGQVPGQVTWAHWEYPELVTDGADGVAEPEAPSKTSLTSLDLMCEPVVVPLGHGNLSVVLRRVSLWLSERRVVIFLDRTHQGDQVWKRSRRQVSVTKSLPGMAKDKYQWETQLPQQRALPAIEESLYASFEAGGSAMEDGIESALLGAVYKHWLELFEALPEPGAECYRTSGGRVMWQMLQALEQNVQMGRFSGVKETRWDGLLRRLERTAGFTARSIPASQDAAPKEDTGEKVPPAPGTELSNDQGNLLDWEKFNRHSIDRITYLGGIMLPLTVVSGILGIEGRYGPEGTQFWVFWVAAFVSSAICLFIIYLDQLRSLDVWFEVAAGDAVEALFPQEASGLSQQREDSLQAAGHPPRRVYSNRHGDIAVEEGGKLHHLTSSSSSGRVRRAVWVESGGEGGKAWKREALGWGGAMKKSVGYYRFKGGNVQFNRPEPGGGGGS